MCCVKRDVIVFIFLKNDSFVLKTTTKKLKTKRSFFQKVRFIKLVVLIMILNNGTLLTIINEEKRREETDLKGIGTYQFIV